MEAQFTTAPDYAVAQLSLDGQKIGSPVNLFSYAVAPTGPIFLGRTPLTKGNHTLTIEMVGHDLSARLPIWQIGLDYVKFRTARED